MDKLEHLVDKFSAQLETQVNKEVPVAFKLAVSDAIKHLSREVRSVKGHLRSGIPDYLFIKRNDGVLLEGHEEDGTYNTFVAAGVFRTDDAEQLAALIVHRRPSHYTFEVYVKKGDKTGADALLAVLNTYMTEKNPVKGKIINLNGDVKELGHLDWDGVALPQAFRTELELNILFPITNYETLKNRGLFEPRGVLLAGDVGMGKSLVGRVVAAKVVEKGGTVVMTNPHEIAQKGGWEYAFEVAGTLKPTLLYFEDVETEGTTGNPKMYQLAEYLDGMEDRRDVTILATTNELESLDRRLRDRPGRIDRILRFNPVMQEFGVDWRKQVLEIHLNGNTGVEADPAEIAKLVGSRPYTGAHLANLVSSAKTIVLHGQEPEQLSNPHGNIVLTPESITAAIQAMEKTYHTKRQIGESFRPQHRTQP